MIVRWISWEFWTRTRHLKTQPWILERFDPTRDWIITQENNPPRLVYIAYASLCTHTHTHTKITNTYRTDTVLTTPSRRHAAGDFPGVSSASPQGHRLCVCLVHTVRVSTKAWCNDSFQMRGRCVSKVRCVLYLHAKKLLCNRAPIETRQWATSRKWAQSTPGAFAAFVFSGWKLL